MKICRIIYTYSPFQVGGGDIYTSKISRALAVNGHEEVIICINPIQKDIVEEDGSIKIYRFPSGNVSTFHTIAKKSLLLQGIWTLLDIYSPYAYYKISGILKKERPDVVHIHTPIDVTLAAFDAVAALGLPAVLTIHDYIFLCRRFVLLHSTGDICTRNNINHLCRIYRRFCMAVLNDKVDMLISPNRFSLDLYRDNGFFKKCEAVVLPHGIDLDRAGNPNNKENDSPERSILNISYSGGLTKHKGVHLLISAFLLIQNENIRLNIAGGGAYEKELRRMAGDDKRIIFHGKFVNKEMRQFYHEADVLVVPSIWYDVRPNVIPEAFREGVPVIGADIGGIPELIIENQTGFLFKPGDAEDLKRVIEKVINNPQALKKLRKNVLEFVKQFEMSKYLDKLIGVYQQAIEINNRKKTASKTAKIS